MKSKCKTNAAFYILFIGDLYWRILPSFCFEHLVTKLYFLSLKFSYSVKHHFNFMILTPCFLIFFACDLFLFSFFQPFHLYPFSQRTVPQFSDTRFQLVRKCRLHLISIAVSVFYVTLNAAFVGLYHIQTFVVLI